MNTFRSLAQLPIGMIRSFLAGLLIASQVHAGTCADWPPRIPDVQASMVHRYKTEMRIESSLQASGAPGRPRPWVQIPHSDSRVLRGQIAGDMEHPILVSVEQRGELGLLFHEIQSQRIPPDSLRLEELENEDSLRVKGLYPWPLGFRSQDFLLSPNRKFGMDLYPAVDLFSLDPLMLHQAFPAWRLRAPMISAWFLSDRFVLAVDQVGSLVGVHLHPFGGRLQSRSLQLDLSSPTARVRAAGVLGSSFWVSLKNGRLLSFDLPKAFLDRPKGSVDLPSHVEMEDLQPSQAPPLHQVSHIEKSASGHSLLLGSVEKGHRGSFLISEISGGVAEPKIRRILNQEGYLHRIISMHKGALAFTSSSENLSVGVLPRKLNLFVPARQLHLRLSFLSPLEPVKGESREDKIQSLAYSSRKNILAVGTISGMIHLFSGKTGDWLTSFRSPSIEVLDLDFSLDAELLSVTSHRGGHFLYKLKEILQAKSQ